MATLRRKHRAGALLTSQPANRSRTLRSTGFYYRVGKQPKEPSKTNRSKGQAPPPCDMPRSERGRIRGNCRQRIALPSLAQAPAAGGAPAHRAGASRRTGLSPSGDRWAGLGERSKAVSEDLRTVARAWARGR
jgi:hypothetical protein